MKIIFSHIALPVVSLEVLYGHWQETVFMGKDYTPGS
jgi:hypothetical protein